jgi:hypothetical protein
VGLSASALALKISSGPVLTAALDFSFSLDSFHAKAAPQALAWLCRQNRLSGFINAGAAARRGTFAAVSKEKKRVLSNIGLKNYRDLFEEEFGGEKRMADIRSSGLPLGIPVLSLEEARAILAGNADAPGAANDAAAGKSAAGGAAGKGSATADSSGNEPSGEEAKRKQVLGFIEKELSMLRSIRAALSGEGGIGEEEFEKRLDACDYLWAHFPECAGVGGKRPCTRRGEGLSFLKRVRAELDPFIAHFEKTKGFINFGR